jgi:hypothetical protein
MSMQAIKLNLKIVESLNIVWLLFPVNVKRRLFVSEIHIYFSYCNPNISYNLGPPPFHIIY